MHAYSIANYTVRNPDKYMEYIRRVGKTVAQFGGKTIVADHEHQPFEGKPAQVVVVTYFPSWEKAKAWYASAEYQSIVQFRKESCDGWVTLCHEFKSSL